MKVIHSAAVFPSLTPNRRLGSPCWCGCPVRFKYNGACVKCSYNRARALLLRKRFTPEHYRRLSFKKYRRIYDKGRRSLLSERLVNRTPAWADLGRIRAIYMKAQRMSLTVDHIVPLKGERVSGLHVENNLRIIGGPKNSSKGNRFKV